MIEKRCGNKVELSRHLNWYVCTHKYACMHVCVCLCWCVCNEHKIKLLVLFYACLGLPRHTSLVVHNDWMVYLCLITTLIKFYHFSFVYTFKKYVFCDVYTVCTYVSARCSTNVITPQFWRKKESVYLSILFFSFKYVKLFCFTVLKNHQRKY